MRSKAEPCPSHEKPKQRSYIPNHVLTIPTEPDTSTPGMETLARKESL